MPDNYKNTLKATLKKHYDGKLEYQLDAETLKDFEDQLSRLEALEPEKPTEEIKE